MTQLWREYIEHISASQILDYLRNPRRWVMAKLAKLPTCDSSATQIGSMIHKAIEEYLHGMPGTVEHALADHCLRALVDNVEFGGFLERGQYDVERLIKFVYDLDMPPIVGYVDMILWKFYKGCPLIIDHKTSKTRKYFKSAVDLKTDIQLIIYCKWILQQSPHIEGVFVQHNQFAYSNKRDVLQTKRTFICKARIDREWNKILHIIKDMMRTLNKYSDKGLSSISVESCEDCNKRFGMNSCEFNCICEGRCNEDGYKAKYSALKAEQDTVTIWDMREATSSAICMFEDITKEKPVSNEIQINPTYGPKVSLDADDAIMYTGPYDRYFIITDYVVYIVVKDHHDHCVAGPTLPFEGLEKFISCEGIEINNGRSDCYKMILKTNLRSVIIDNILQYIPSECLKDNEKIILQRGLTNKSEDVLIKVNSEATSSAICMFEDLTNKSEDVIIKVNSEGTKMNIAELMQKAREQVGDKGSIFDRREAWTKAIVTHVLKSGVSKVAVPSHFASGSIDPDYQQIITQLKENGVSVIAELEV